MYLDTGAMYRTCAVASIKKGINAKDPEEVKKMMDEIRIEVKFIDGVQHMFLDGEDVTGELRTPQTSIAASDVSAHPVVRTDGLTPEGDRKEPDIRTRRKRHRIRCSS